MKSLRNIVAVLLISQFISGCIALIPPSYRESNRETVIVIYEPYPVPEPIYIEAPVISTVQPIERPNSVVKYRKPEEKRSAERKESVESRNTTERIRNSGERRGR